MSFSLRHAWLAAVISITGCVGGPVSDLPHSGSGDGPTGGGGEDDEGTSGGLDAGAVPQLDAGAGPRGDAADADASIPCGDAGAPHDGG